MITAAVLVKLAAAVICFNGACHPVLVGADTPVGVFSMHEREVLSRGYDGDIIQFKETSRYVFGIHRVWLLDPAQHREARLRSNNPKVRHITSGCVNLSDSTYDTLKALVRLHPDTQLIIEK